MPSNLLTADQVAVRLGVKLSTVYAYVSRGLLTRTVAEDGRTSRFDPAEVEALARRGRPRANGRSAGTVDVMLTSAITEVQEGRLRYRGHDAAQLTVSATFESVAELLWTGQLQSTAEWDARDEATEAADRARLLFAAPGPDRISDVSERLAAATAAVAATDPLRVDLHPDSVTRQARTLIRLLVDTLPLQGPPVAVPEGRRRFLAWRLWPHLSALRPSRPRIRVLDAALILLADHELATSTFAARVAASTRADPYAVVLAALGTMSGPLHGKAAVAVQELLVDTEATGSAETAVARLLARGERIPGFGHVVYRDGDPRAECLMELLDPLLTRRARSAIEGVRAAAARTTDAAPNIDFALGAFGYVAQSPLGATEAVFAIARTAGWIAHALEEYDEAPLRFRARALYTGAGDADVGSRAQ